MGLVTRLLTIKSGMAISLFLNPCRYQGTWHAPWRAPAPFRHWSHVEKPAPRHCEHETYPGLDTNLVLCRWVRYPCRAAQMSLMVAPYAPWWSAWPSGSPLMPHLGVLARFNSHLSHKFSAF